MSPSVDLFKAKTIHLSYISQLASSNEEKLPPSFVFPHSYWTPVQKNAFYKSLVRHSRWQPELIAADMDGEKTIEEVCSYIELLEQASIQTPLRYPNCPAAREVTESWITLEETLCAELSRDEKNWQSISLKRERNGELKEIKRLNYDGMGSKGKQVLDNKNLPDVVDSPVRQERFSSRKEELVAKWKREDFLMSLDARHLRTLGAITLALEGKEREQEPEFFTSNKQLVRDADLLHGDITIRTTNTSPDIRIDQQDNSILPEGAGSYTMNEPHLPSTQYLPRNLSPASRRRLRKRLWTRRKRAQESGIPFDKVSMDFMKLKRGRKRNAKSLSITTSEGVIVPDNTEMSESSRIGTATPQRLEYKLPGNDNSKRNLFGWSRLISLGIDAESLRKDGIDLFHLEKVANLARLYHQVGSSQVKIEDSSHIHDSTYLPYKLLQFLRACVVHFVTRVIAYTITHKEIDVRQRRRNRSLCMHIRTEKVKGETIHAVLAVLRQKRDSKAIFQQLKKALRQSISSLEDHDNGTQESSEDEKDLSPEQDNLFENAPFVNVPFTLSGESRMLAASPWDPTVFAHFHEKNILPSNSEEVDVNEIRKELQMDEIVNEDDQYADLLYEQRLWAEVKTGVDATPRGDEINLRSPTSIRGSVDTRSD